MSDKNMIILGASIVALCLYHQFAGGRRRNPRLKYSVPIQNDEDEAIGETHPYTNWKEFSLSEAERTPVHETVFHAFQNSVKKYPKNNCYADRNIEDIIKEEKIVNGVKKTWEFFKLGPYVWQTYEEIYERVLNFGSGLRANRLNPGDKIALFEDTRPEWTISAFGAFSQRLTVLTVYANLGDEALVYALNQAEITHLITNGSLLPKINKLIDQIPTLDTIIYLDSADEAAVDLLKGKDKTIYTFAQIEEAGKQDPVDIVPPMRDDLALIMYTSGSTGMPKGVMISHQNVIYTIHSVLASVPAYPNDIYLSYLPLAHILAFDVECAMLCLGASIGRGRARSLTDQAVRDCKGDIRELCPTFFVGVPVILDKIANGIRSKIRSSSALAKKFFDFSLNVRLGSLEQGRDTPLLNLILFNKFKDLLGGRVRFIISGGAPLSIDCAKLLKGCFGVPVMQGYALTETCGGGTIMELDDVAFGPVGPPILNVQMKLVDVTEMNYTSKDEPNPRGEIWIRGPVLSSGYYLLPEKTAEDFRDGWFATGDIGTFLPNGTVKIIDRKKNLVKPPHGEYIALERLESIYKNCVYVEIICVHASSERNEVLALVCPNKKNLQIWAEKNNIHMEWEDLCNDPRAREVVLKDLATVGLKAGLRSIEKVLNLRLYPDEWTPDSGLLTASMKIKRHDVIKQYASDIDEMYSEMGTGE